MGEIFFACCNRGTGSRSGDVFLCLMVSGRRITSRGQKDLDQIAGQVWLFPSVIIMITVTGLVM